MNNQHHHKNRIQRRHDDLILEPSGDYDLVYGDDPSTMTEDGDQRPYIRLSSFLSNQTRDAGNEVRFKCEAAGSPLPITFQWLKNHVPLEKQKRVKIRNKDYSSKLTITELDVLDSAYYQCIVSNSAGSVNSTAVLRVNKATNNQKNTKNKPNKGKHNNLEISGEEISNDYFDEMDGGRLIDEEDKPLDGNTFTVGGESSSYGQGKVDGFGEVGVMDQWLNEVTLKVGECIPYKGSACRDYLRGKYVMVTSENREDIYDIDRNLRAATTFIQNMRGVKSECKQYSHAVACYHMFKVCHQPQISKGGRRYGGGQNVPNLTQLCHSDCQKLTNQMCPEELTLAAAHELVGDGPKAMLPKCDSLPPDTSNCFALLGKPNAKEEVVVPEPFNLPKNDKKNDEWCYMKDGSKYNGNVETSKTGKVCSHWVDANSQDFNVITYPQLKSSRNYCRNPGGKRNKPWCYVGHGEEEYCSIEQCPSSITFENDNSNSLGSQFTKMWKDVPQQYQLMTVCATGIFSLFLVFLICCLCCCRNKKKNNVNRRGLNGDAKEGKKHLMATAHDETTTTTSYNRMMGNIQGSSGVGMDNGIGSPYEISSLLSRGTNPYHSNGMSHPMMQQQHIPYSQHSHPSSDPPAEPYVIPEIESQYLKPEDMIGEGFFSYIRIGSYKKRNTNNLQQVVIVSLKPHCSKMEKENFEESLTSVASFEHPNILKLLGACYLIRTEISGIFDYEVQVDLNQFLKRRSTPNNLHDHGDSDDFLKIALQIAQGMDYLCCHGFVHQDLATRNCYISDERTIKISTFHMIRNGYEEDYYKAPHKPKLPLRWLSKEAFQLSRFTSASDVWMFGVTLWELFSKGKAPYANFSNEDVVEMINMRSLLECPTNCPPSMYSLIIECWNEHPDRRPSFSELSSRLQSMCINGAMQQPFLHLQNRASSSISGGSGAGPKTNKTTSSSHSSSFRNNATILAGNLNGAAFHHANNSGNPQTNINAVSHKMTNLGGLIHSTPISQKNRRHQTAEDSPLMTKLEGNCDYSDDDGDADSD
uniref:Receptor protein-tyrosine kinase n=1 Tax=Rhabditophanes sp. KR3021 TaxID=114890 RepID=A0AC35TWX3_9BILA